jgi:hypothetical protein
MGLVSIDGGRVPTATNEKATARVRAVNAEINQLDEQRARLVEEREWLYDEQRRHVAVSRGKDR